MDAVEFFKTVNRLCRNQGCNTCPAAKDGSCMVGFDDDSIKSIGGTVSKVEQWAKDNPTKTRQSEFLKMFPKAPMRDDVIDVCPATVVKGLKNGEHCNHILCKDCRKTFWLMEVADND